MSKFVFDADALIKLVRAGIFERLAHENIISAQVYEEAVVEGKRKLYEDAFHIEKLIEKKRVRVEQTSAVESIPGLGKGERSALALFTKLNADAIITDDRRFISHLEEKGIPMIIPTEIIVALGVKRVLTKEEAKEALERIRPFVTKENHQRAIEAIGGTR
jgi:predicted nucleic acid-binding protein